MRTELSESGEDRTLRSAPTCRWYADRRTRALIGLRYLPLLAALNLAWEVAQLPLYTLWSEAPAAYVAFSVAHCTVGDVMIGAGALAAALVVARAADLAHWRWIRIAVMSTLAGLAYTVFSEWMNTVVLQSWKYSELMPVLHVSGVQIGLSPLAQWAVVPPAALWLTRFTLRGEPP